MLLRLQISKKTYPKLNVKIGATHGGAVCECLAESVPVPIKRIGINDVFGESGSAGALIKKYGLDAEGIYKAVKLFL